MTRSKSQNQITATETATQPSPTSYPSELAVANGPRPYNGVAIRELTVNTPANQWPTSLDASVPEQCAAIFNAGNPPDVSVGLGEVITFVAVHWLIYLEEFEDEETGELRPGPVLTLYDRDGRTFRTTSQFAPRRLKAALELYSKNEWIKGITFVIRDRPSKRPGRHYHDIRIVVDSQ
jgi:hypothetical protein